jgi:hypothetical protein
MTVRGSAESLEARLAAGRLRSPYRGAVLARWGWARRRVVAMLAGPEEFCARRAGAAAAAGPMCCCLRICGHGAGMGPR